jgi:hypothetical protein
MDHRLIRRHIQMQVWLVHTPEGAPGGPQCRARALTGMAMAFAWAIALLIARPCVDPMANRGMGWMTAAVALPRIRVQRRAVSQPVVGDECLARPPVCLVAHPKARLARLAREDPDDRGPIVRSGAVALALMGPSAWRVARVAMGRAFCPPRCGTARLPQRRCPPSPRWVRWRSAGSGGAAVGCGAVGATAPARVRGGPSRSPWAIPRRRRTRGAGG